LEQLSFLQINIEFIKFRGVTDSGLQHWAFPGFLVDLQSSTGYDADGAKVSGIMCTSYRVIGAK
jgi:hypothetical protein